MRLPPVSTVKVSAGVSSTGIGWWTSPAQYSGQFIRAGYPTLALTQSPETADKPMGLYVSRSRNHKVVWLLAKLLLCGTATGAWAAV